MKAASTVCLSIRFVLRIFGVWPGVSCVILYRLFWSALLIVTQIFQYAYFVLHYRTDDLADLMDNLSCCLAYGLLFFKLIIFWFNERKFREILTMIATDWKECANDSFSIHVTSSMASASYRISNMIIGLHMVAVLTYSFGVIFASEIEENSSNATSAPLRELIIKMELPFDSNSSPIYELVLFVQFFELLSIACGIDVLNALIMTLVLHVGGQIDILREWLTNVFSQGGVCSTSGITIKSIIEKHQRIIAFSENVESLYSYIALMQFISNTLIICSIGFVIVSSVGSPDAIIMLVKTLLFYIVMNLEAFIFCFAGEYLSTKSQNIADAAYGSLWYDMQAIESRPISFLILRSQKRLTITIGKVTDLSLARFTSVVKASGSYVSMLLAMS